MIPPAAIDTSTLRDRLRDGAPVDLVWLSLGSTALAEIAAHAGPGCLVIDLQHGLWDRLALEAAVAVARGRVPVMARVADDSAHAISQALDAGADAVLVPLVDSAAQAARAVAACRYPPDGLRSAGGLRPLLYGVPAAEVNRRVAVGVMIETLAGVAEAEAIAATPGLDFVFIGSGDLGLSKGPGHAEGIEPECRRVQAACAARGLPCGIFTPNAEQAAERLAQGYRLVVSANDIGLMTAGLAAASKTLAAGTAGPDAGRPGEDGADD